MENSNSNSNQEVCRYFLRGFCKYGNACRFYHPGSQTLDNSAANRTSSDYQVCKFYQQGRCKFGDSCRYRHIEPLAIDQIYGDEGLLDRVQLDMFMQGAQNLRQLTEEALDLEQRFRNIGLTEGEAPVENLGQMFWNIGLNEGEVVERDSQGVRLRNSDAEDVLSSGSDFDPFHPGNEHFDPSSLDRNSSNEDND